MGAIESFSIQRAYRKEPHPRGARATWGGSHGACGTPFPPVTVLVFQYLRSPVGTVVSFGPGVSPTRGLSR